ncbi:SGNH/GDSL hydrolase family protein [Kribbella sp. CA-293567]|uniref:SGNH/GDSL hydrolase family protein n=1 Tax=Kribbella sp. CA-293567 TaxID=3002436 RepID=UPI0022DD2FDE|nr:SGNH/GDSL hydrolase family protein [Kribbella sp. CA-293567]WBQ08115.1 SGNH/GDSL hydrolase family protein [Kribbella sp. CA-293567]
MITPGSRYVALGSSFAAGPGIKPIVDKAAGRSASNYPHLVAEALGLELTDVTYSGATTATILRDRQDDAPPQLDAVGPETALVTITAGGNDLEYIGTFVRGSLMNTLAKPAGLLGKRVANRVRARVSYLKDPAQYDAVAASLTEIVLAVRERAPQSRILLVDYLTVAGPATRARLDVPLNEEQLPSVVMMADGLAKAFATAAERTGAGLVTASAASLDHAVGSPEPWVTGFRLRGGAPYHPTAAGMAAVAELIVAELRPVS